MNRLATIAVALLMTVATALQAAEPVSISPAGHKAMSPEMAVAPDGTIYVIWLERTPEGEAIAAQGAASKEGHTHHAEADIWLVRSTDGGATFSAPLRVNAKSGEVWGFPISKPRIAVSPAGVVHIFHPGNAIEPRSGKPIVLPMITRSRDGGRTFEAARVLGAVPDSDNSHLVTGLANAECFGTMTLDERGGVYTYWIDTRDMSKEQPNAKVFSAVSYDDGATYSRDTEVLPADTCPCCQLTATTQAGRIYLGSRQVSPDGERDSAVAISTDRGRSFAPRSRWGGARWKIDACPLKATALVVDGDLVYTASFNGGATPPGAWLSRSLDGGRTFEPAQALHAAAPVSDGPVLAVVGGALVAAWHAKTDGAERHVFVSISRDRGQTFSAPAQVPASSGNGIYPVLAARDGGVQLAWQQGDTIVTRHLKLDDPLFGAQVARAQ